MAVDRKKLVEKLQSATPEERALFREALQEAEPEAFLSLEEMLAIRKMLEGAKKPKEKKSLIDLWFGGE
jgi:hypothetical protein